MSRRRGRYRMTPKRKAALRKAQLASARKRRGSRWTGLKNTAKVVGSVAGTIAVGAAIYHAESYARDPGKAVRHVKLAHRWMSRSPQPPAQVQFVNPIGMRRRAPRPPGGFVAGSRIGRNARGISARQRSRV